MKPLWWSIISLQSVFCSVYKHFDLSWNILTIEWIVIFSLYPRLLLHTHHFQNRYSCFLPDLSLRLWRSPHFCYCATMKLTSVVKKKESIAFVLWIAENFATHIFVFLTINLLGIFSVVGNYLQCWFPSWRVNMTGLLLIYKWYSPLF